MSVRYGNYNNSWYTPLGAYDFPLLFDSSTRLFLNLSFALSNISLKQL